MRISRRKFIELAGSFGASLAWRSAFARGSSIRWRERRDLYPQGVASADPHSDSVILWKTEDLGRLTVEAAYAQAKGTLKPGDKTFKAGALGDFEIQGDNILLGRPFVFNKENIDQFNF